MNPEIITKENQFQQALKSLDLNQKEAGLPEELRALYQQMYQEYFEISSDDPEYPSVTLGKEADKKVDEESLKLMSEGHKLHYGRDILMLVDLFGQWDFAVHISGMYGGKSTLGLTFADYLKDSHGEDVAMYIAGAMGEMTIKSRALIENPERMARGFGGYNDETRETKIREVLSGPESVILLDEYSFINPVEDVISLLHSAREQGKRVILLGLDTSYLGVKLGIFQHPYFKQILKDKVKTRIIPGRSYIVGEGRLRLQAPTGVGTIRYLNVGTKDNPLYLLDLGIGELIISKEKEYIRYFPSLHRLSDIFGGHPFFRKVLRDTKPLQQTSLAYHQTLYTQHLERNFK